MKEGLPKADLVARIVHKEIHGYPGPPRAPEDEAEFMTLLDRLRLEGRERLDVPTPSGPASVPVQAVRVQIYLCACGLAALGRADALVDVFEYLDVTTAGSGAWRLAALLTEGLPMPRRTDGAPDPASAKQWMKDHVAEIVWNRHERRFELSST